MTNAQLIKELSRFPSNLEVMFPDGSPLKEVRQEQVGNKEYIVLTDISVEDFWKGM